ncbi:MAG: rnhA [Lachnospiraceae bacterium]|jgi:ribonuclease HI|nr:rnhA [Lachnospiraceae bacterium]
MEVNIYIDVYHSGHLKKGSGTYNIVLEYAPAGVPWTKQYIYGVRFTTKNRTAIIACISALEHIVKPCDINIKINSEYITQAINSNAWFTWLSTGKNAKNQPVKNMDLWQQLFDLVDKYHVTFEYVEKNPYTSYMQTMAKKENIEYKEDTNNV